VLVELPRVPDHQPVAAAVAVAAALGAVLDAVELAVEWIAPGVVVSLRPLSTARSVALALLAVEKVQYPCAAIPALFA
jgi:hypothetical protein